MSKPLRHTKSEQCHAAKLAFELGMTVRLEADGAITFIPNNVDLENNTVANAPFNTQKPKEWN